MLEETKGGFLITQIKQVSGRIFEALLTEAGIGDFNGPQGRILYVLWQEDGIPIVRLSAKTGLAKTTLTSMLDRMEAGGLVARAHDPKDRRQLRIHLTDKARGLEQAYRTVSLTMNHIYYAGFSDQEIQAFEESLERVLFNLQEREQQK